MKFSATILAAAFAVAALPSATAFSTASRGVVKSAVASRSVAVVKKSNCNCGGCSACTQKGKNCGCAACSGLTLLMSEIDEAEPVAEVPAEVEAMDGVASEEEAHNVDRPARGSGIHKHQKDGSEARVALKDLVIGESVKAKVKTITAYGAFLDIGAASDALVHVSRLSDDFVSNVEDVLTRGQDIDVRIISVDSDKNQIGVTMRSEEAEARAAEGQSNGRPTRRRERPARSGADQAAQAASINALAAKGVDDTKFVEGEVVSSLDFGAFVRFDTAQLGEGLEGELDGLVHISALAEGRTSAVSDIVSIGDKVQVRVRSVDSDAGRVSLSMITKEQEDARPAPRERKGGGGRGFDPVGSSWKNTGAADWKEQLEEFSKVQETFTNTAVIQDRRK